MSEIVATEIATFGETHAYVGAQALDAWGFPHPFVEAVSLHQHGVELASHALGRILRVAEAVSLEHAPMPGYPAPADLERLLASVRLHVRDFDTIIREVDEQLDRLADFLGVEP